MLKVGDADQSVGSESQSKSVDTPVSSPRVGQQLAGEEAITASTLDKFLGKSKLVKAMQGDINDVKGSVDSMAKDQRAGFNRLEALLSKNTRDAGEPMVVPDVLPDDGAKRVTAAMHDNF
eukprot:4508483-Karenia_brevis.AAC.1